MRPSPRKLRYPFLRSLWICCALLGSAEVGAQGRPTPTGLDAKQVLDRMAEVYAGCRSYRDSGVVEELFVRPDGSRYVQRKSFETAFVRPDRFRFEYRERFEFGTSSGHFTADPEERYIIWRRGQDVQTWWDIRPGVEREESLNRALWGAKGVSSSASHYIPALLMPKEIKGCWLRCLEDATLTETRVGGVDWLRIEGSNSGSPMVLWVEPETFLLRRIHGEFKLRTGGNVEKVIKFEPAIDVEIEAKLLEFNPPERR